MNEARAFGVELECGYGDPSLWQAHDVATDVLDSNGLRLWAVCFEECCSGVEVASPILRGAEGLAELRRVMELLAGNGFYTTERDGLHVHHEAPEWKEDSGLVAHTLELWEANLSATLSRVAPCRARSVYCELDRYDGHGALNLTALEKFGTLEFRLHEGTLDFEGAASWIEYTQQFLEGALASSPSPAPPHGQRPQASASSVYSPTRASRSASLRLIGSPSLIGRSVPSDSITQARPIPSPPPGSPVSRFQ